MESYFLNITAEDIHGNQNNITIKIIVQETIPPVWMVDQISQNYSYNEEIFQILQAYDPSGVFFSVNDDRFEIQSIDNEFILTNLTVLQLMEYSVMLVAEDIYGNEKSAIITITIEPPNSADSNRNLLPIILPIVIGSSAVAVGGVVYKKKKIRPAPDKKSVSKTKLKEIDTSNKNQEDVLLEKFNRILQGSNRISQDNVAIILKLSKVELIEKLYDWMDKLPFKISGNDIVVDDISNFMDTFDEQFSEWVDNEEIKRGKIE